MLTKSANEKAILVGVALKGSKSRWPLEDSVAELADLARTAEVDVVGQLIQRLEKPSPSYLGKGKLNELIELREKLNYEVAIFDDELSPNQQVTLEEALQVKVIDRTALILDIFAKHASTREGQLQVELAQHQYLLPRLAGQWSHLERLGAGIGTRGPGESQLETDRRLIKRRIQHIQSEIEVVRKHRVLYRQNRRRSGIPVIALVGYTNAGKSTLMNALTGADVLVEDKLFATLDPVTRRLTLPSHQQVLLTDTVGFINKLPTTVVAAFRATLEELEEAHLLVHVVDVTHKNAAEQFQTVEDTLSGLKLQNRPRITLLNKIDMLLNNDEVNKEEVQIDEITNQFKVARQGMILISAIKGWGIDKFLGLADDLIERILVKESDRDDQ